MRGQRHGLGGCGELDERRSLRERMSFPPRVKSTCPHVHVTTDAMTHEHSDDTEKNPHTKKGGAESSVSLHSVISSIACNQL